MYALQLAEMTSRVGKEQLRGARGTRTRAEWQPGSGLRWAPAPGTSEDATGRFCVSFLQHPPGAGSLSAWFLKNHERKEVLE